MSQDAFIVLPRLDLNDLASGTVVRIFVRVASGSIPCFFGFEHGGDIEIEPSLEDCQQVVDLLKHVLDLDRSFAYLFALPPEASHVSLVLSTGVISRLSPVSKIASKLLTC